MKTPRLLLLASVLLICACGDRKPADDGEPVEDYTYKYGDTRYTLISFTSGTDTESARRVTFIEQKLEKAGVRYFSNGNLGVTSIVVPIEDRKRAQQALAGLIDDKCMILPLK